MSIHMKKIQQYLTKYFYHNAKAFLKTLKCTFLIPVVDKK